MFAANSSIIFNPPQKNPTTIKNWFDMRCILMPSYWKLCTKPCLDLTKAKKAPSCIFSVTFQDNFHGKNCWMSPSKLQIYANALWESVSLSKFILAHLFPLEHLLQRKRLSYLTMKSGGLVFFTSSALPGKPEIERQNANYEQREKKGKTHSQVWLFSTRGEGYFLVRECWLSPFGDPRSKESPLGGLTFCSHCV